MSKKSDEDPLDREFSPGMFSSPGVRGKYYARVMKGSNVVRLSPEVARAFPTEQAVNQALLSLVELSKNLPQIQPTAGRRKSSTS